MVVKCCGCGIIHVNLVIMIIIISINNLMVYSTLLTYADQQRFGIDR